MKAIMQDTYEFGDIIGKGCIYVDKTAFFHRLITAPGSSQYFISRPRRFGKSLMISTLEQIFKGNRELFKGLAIEGTDYQWPTFPVLHFDFSKVSTSSFEEFKTDFADNVRAVLKEAGFESLQNSALGFDFGCALKHLKARDEEAKAKAREAGNHLGGEPIRSGVAVLIDEYDAPISHALDRPELAEEIRREMSNFYIQLKGSISCVRFLMITGVSKFSKLSVFSALNNLVDLSFKGEYATMLGFTEEELTEYFAEHMQEHAKVMGLSYGEYRRHFKRWYDGYRFSRNCQQAVYNPVSVSLALDAKDKILSGYWSQTGKSSTMAAYVNSGRLCELDPECVPFVSESAFDVGDFRDISTEGLLYQCGYLTIKDFDYETETYTLCVPNEEVRRDFASLFLCAMTGRGNNWVMDLKKDLLTTNWERVREKLSAIYASAVYGSREKVVEASFQRQLVPLWLCFGFNYALEEHQAEGRADTIVKTGNIYILEFKVGVPARDAIAQIKANNYAAPYLAGGKKIYALGLSFSRETRQLVDFAWEEISGGPTA